MDRTQKEATIAALHGRLAETSLVVVIHHLGLTVKEVTDLRGKVRAAGASFKVTKNRLARRALTDTSFEGLDGLFKGPTAITYGKDPVATAKVIVEYARTNDKVVLLGAGLGRQVLDADGVKALATLPSLEQLRASLLGMIQTPATRIAGVLQAPGGQIARVLSAYAKKDEQGEAA